MKFFSLKSLFKKLGGSTIDESGAPNARKTTSGFFIVILLVVTLGAGSAAYYFWHKNSELKSDPQKIAQGEIVDIVKKVGELIMLPEGETPTVATVTDPEQLRDQSFFAKAKVGDKVLIYTNARKAILYSPAQNKIIEVAPLNIGGAEK